jgi:dTDP-4-dehydrorhamnose reductase
MIVAITGAKGQLGRELQALAPADSRVHAVDVDELDITDAAATAAWIGQLKPAVIFNAAAYTAVDRAEAEPEVARRINAAGAIALAEAGKAHGARLIHVSTDYVFDGQAARPYATDAAPNPLGVYGQTKLEGERGVLSTLGVGAMVVRTAWLYSMHGNNFVKTMLKLFREREEVRVVADQIGTPTWARGLAGALWAAAARPDLSGVYHWTDAGVASWYDFAVAIQEEGLALGLLARVARVSPIRTEEYPTPARRPACSILDSSKSWRDLSVRPDHWRVALRHMMKDLPKP